MRIDAHHHLWRYNPQEFDWISDDAAALRRDFLPAEFEQTLAEANMDASILVQARCSIDETRWLLDCASQSQRIAAVVGWLPLSSPQLPALLDEFSMNPQLAGFREIAQDQPPGFLLAPAFNDGLRQLTQRDFTYDILIRAHQMEEATRFVDLHPRQRFVLDHAGKPEIAQHRIHPWSAQLKQLAQRPNVMCKLSGLVTEADWRRWNPEDLKPFLDLCLEAFGPSRCMAGSDWPVCLVASSYTRWWKLLERWASALTQHEQSQIFGLTAAAFYGCETIPHPPAEGSR